MVKTSEFVGESFGKPESVEQCLAIMAEVAEEQRDRNRHLDTKAGSIAGFAGTALTLNLTLGRPLLEQHFSTYPWAHGLIRDEIRALVGAVPDPSLGSVLKDLLARNRLLDRGNPTSRSLGRDFGRFGFDFWPAVEADDRRNRNRKGKLDQLCAWRNAIVHGDVSGARGSGRLTPRDLDLTTCRDWRRALGGLADSIDKVVAVGCQDLGCSEPW